MNFDNYKNDVPYPRKADFTVRYYYKGGQVIGKLLPNETPLISFNGCVTETVTDNDAFYAARDVYSRRATELTEMFIRDILHDFGMADNEFTRRLYDVAYANGHSSGLASVYDCFSDLSSLNDLALKVYGK